MRPSVLADYGKLYTGDYMRGNWAWRASGKTDAPVRFWLEVSW
jgi:hypothetical protein